MSEKPDLKRKNITGRIILWISWDWFSSGVFDGAIYLDQQGAITFRMAALWAHWFQRQFLLQFLLWPARIRGRKNIKFTILCSHAKVAFDISYDAVLTQTSRNLRNGRCVYFRSIYVERCNILFVNPPIFRALDKMCFAKSHLSSYVF